MQTGHEDLTDNVNTSLNHDYSGNNDVYDPSKARGTHVAGIIAAAGDNSLGVRGVAPQAGIYSYNLAANFSNANAKDAMIRNRDITAVSINNWGPEDTSVLIEASSEWEEGVGMGIREWLGDKGIFYVWATGNRGDNRGQANFDEYSNYYAVTTVCSVDGEGNKSSFSEEGVNLWVCAPGEDITTTDNNNGYVFDASGTAYSAAQVAGVAALMREVNSDLSWRDLKLILAASARKNDASDTDWETGAHKYGSDTESYNYNPKYGFGVVDAEAAVGLAESWASVGGMRASTISSGPINMAIPDRTPGVDGEATAILTIPDTFPSFTEFIEIEISFTHPFFPELKIQITSPDGTVSQLTEEHSRGASHSFAHTDRTHRFGLARHLGEDPAGEWSLKISDTSIGDTGTLHSWSIRVYGHKTGNTVPGFGSETIDNKEYIITGSAITTETLPAATNGNGTLTYSLKPALPTGLDFDKNTRVLSGTPTTATSRTIYTYTVTDTDRDTDELTFSITISSDTEPSFSSETIDNKVYINGITAVMEILPEATGGNAPLTYSLSSGLPAGLDFDKNTRVLSGTPNVGNPSSLPISVTHTYTVTDANGDTADLTFSITTEEDSDPDFSGVTIPARVYTGGEITLPAATGGNPPVTYSITPRLPLGLSFNGNTRKISGTPTRASSAATYMYTATDRNGNTDTLDFMLSVEISSAPPPTRPPTTRRPGTSGTDSGGGGGGCAVSDQNNFVPDLLGAVACLILIPVSVVLRRKRSNPIKT